MSYIIESALNAIFGNIYYTLSRYFMLLIIAPSATVKPADVNLKAPGLPRLDKHKPCLKPDGQGHQNPQNQGIV